MTMDARTPKTVGGEPERLLRMIRERVRDARDLQSSGAEAAAAGARAEIERLQLRLARVVKQNPMWDAGWGRRALHQLSGT